MLSPAATVQRLASMRLFRNRTRLTVGSATLLQVPAWANSGIERRLPLSPGTAWSPRPSRRPSAAGPRQPATAPRHPRETLCPGPDHPAGAASWVNGRGGGIRTHDHQSPSLGCCVRGGPWVFGLCGAALCTALARPPSCAPVGTSVGISRSYTPARPGGVRSCLLDPEHEPSNEGLSQARSNGCR